MHKAVRIWIIALIVISIALSLPAFSTSTKRAKISDAGEAFIGYFLDDAIGDSTNIEGNVNFSWIFYGCSVYAVDVFSDDDVVKIVRVYSATDCNIREGDYIYVIGIKTGPDEMIAYLIEKQTSEQKAFYDGLGIGYPSSFHQ